MKAYSRAVWMALGLMVAAGTVRAADSLGEKKYQAAQNEIMKEKVDAFQKACGSKATFSFDWAALKGLDRETTSPSALCGDFVDGMASFCSADEENKKAVAASVKALKCTMGGEGKPLVIVKDGTVTAQVHANEVNFNDALKAELEKSL